jgi:D-alanine-D-alanine ligase
MKRLRVLVLVHADLVPPEDAARRSTEEMAEWKLEYDVLSGLGEIGHEARALGLSDDLAVLRRAVEEFQPEIAFNLLEEFHGVATYDQHVVAYLELLRRAYTGCNPRGLMLARDKALSKKILTYHRIPVPDFYVFPMNRVVKRPRRLDFPLIVKSVSEEGSLGISQASLVHSDQKLKERVEFIHQSIGTDAIAEEFIEGRELYVGILGNDRLEAFPIWEMFFDDMPSDSVPIATRRVKWDQRYQKRHGIRTGHATDLGDTTRRIERICKRLYRILGLNGYARIDLRLTPDGRIFVLEANPNPNIAYGEDFAESAHKAGVTYAPLLQRIVNLGLRYTPPWKL